MSILIKGMKMPTSCEDCPLEYYDENYYGDEFNYRCPLIYKGYTSNNRYEKRRDDCPLGPVHSHGRMIDADEFLKRAIGTKCFRGDYALMLEELVGESTVIIPAEEGE